MNRPHSIRRIALALAVALSACGGNPQGGPESAVPVDENAMGVRPRSAQKLDSASAGGDTGAVVTRPTAVVPPSISGLAQSGFTLTASPGVWTGSSGYLELFWFRCKPGGTDCAAVAMGTRYAVTDADIGLILQVFAVSTGPGGLAIAPSAPTSPVLPAAPTNVGAPVVSGVAQEGSELTSTSGQWSGAFASVQVSWQRCSADLARCETVATGDRYTPTAADVGAPLRASATATGPGGATTTVSAPTAPVTPAPARNVAAPGISGVAQFGVELVASAGAWEGVIASLELAWIRCTVDGATCDTIASGERYVPGLADVGLTLQVTATATNAGGTASARSAPTAPVLPTAPRNLTPPSIAGTAQEGSALVATGGEWEGDVSAVELTWLRCVPGTTTCAAIGSGDRYALGEADVGHVLQVRAEAIGAGGTATSSSAPTAIVLSAPPSLAEAPRVEGTARDGETLTHFAGAWRGRVTELSVEWLRCDPAGGCAVVAGAAPSYALTYADVGASIRLAVTATGPGGSTRAISDPTAAVLASGPRVVRAPIVSGVLAVGATLELDRGAFAGTEPMDYSIQWLRCDSTGAPCAGVGADADHYVLTAADAGSRIAARVTASNGGGSTAAQSAPTELVRDESTRQRYASKVLGHAPLAFWRLDETGGTLARDASGAAADGTFVGGVTLAQAGALADGTSALFNGTTGRAAFGDRFDLTGNSPFTFEAWIRPTIIDAWHRRIVGKEEKNAVGRFEGYRFAMDASLGLYCERWADGVNTGLVNAPAAQFTTGTWYHVACSYDGVTLRLYVDGVQKAAKSSPQAVADTVAAFTMGSYTNGGSSSFWAGNLDEVAVYGRALAAAELAEHRSAATATAPAAVAAPAVVGLVQTGASVEAQPGTWNGTPPLALAYQWMRCASDGLGCLPVEGGTDRAYLIQGADAGSTLRVSVRAQNAAGGATAISEPTPVVIAPAAWEYCVEAEAADRLGAVQAWAAGPDTAGGTVVLSAAGGGSLRIPFSLPESGTIHAYARVRTPTGANRTLLAGLEPLAPASAALPVSGVLRWQALRPGDGIVLPGRAAQAWPGALPSGHHVLAIAGGDPEVEIDAVCLTNSERGPAERLPEPPNRPIARSVTDFGATGDGITDDTEALRSALASLQPGEALLVPAGRYRFTSKLQITRSDVSLVGEGPDSVLFADFPATSSGNAFEVAGGYESDRTPLVDDAPALARSARIAASAAFAVGDTVLVSSDPWGPTAPNLTTPFYRNRANLLRVTEVRTAGTTTELVFDRPLLGAFSVANNARVERFNGLRGVTVQNLKIEGTANPVPADNADLNLIWSGRCARCFFADLALVGARKAALEVGRSLDCQVIRVHASDASDTGGGGHGYGVALSYAQGTVVRDSLFDGVLRHGVTISWGSRENFVFRNTFDRTANNPENYASVDIHGQDDYANLVEANRISGAQEGIILGGGGTSHGNDGPWNVVRGNRIEGCLYGIPVYKMTWDAVIEGNTVLRSGAYGIRIDTGSDQARVTANRISGYGTSGIYVAGSNDVLVFGNALAGGSAVQIVNSTGYVVQGNGLLGGAVSHPNTGTVAGNW